ncbi:deoxyribonuclease IV [Pediococcus claussenii]|uniref:Probable endonuclease 4 n=1 Tax=Pediococcus claussenii (strain ATCC BAA-344 / DSM 14800 / JCM 18046 / KCTC 3811 / LMG 21948 / P06) TaxID=701521 RepID=G8PD90_PEDCP|nr:deoxyribonuclease IV [Pediococcus claussenii]AEV95225.1 putative endonuclease 4 [Pediococcus claussenii ATCC BAA-344]ANZ70454.1 deoxyribonuclease IV [Pediococcus claussenii]ANZ72269.1 deoxyribonuclease IV [Pediococcus claussenii]KRN19592.1 nfo protein [Pediococcus claussenii]
MIIGSHVSMSGKSMFEGSIQTTINNGANALMVYTGAPQNARRKPIEQLRILEAKKLMLDNNIQDVVVHAPYIVNLANNQKAENYRFAIEFMAQEIERADALGAKQLVLHPGSHVGLGSKKGIDNIIYALNQILSSKQNVQIALETMSGKGTEVARSFEEIATIISGIKYSNLVSVCFDTCHVNDAGYDIKNNLNNVMGEFNHIIGKERIGVVHLNDSKNVLGSHKDRHENIGYGTLGFKALDRMAHQEFLKEIPIILETPWVQLSGEKVSPYKTEISMLKQRTFVDWK